VLIVDDEEDMRVLLRNLITLANDGMSVAAEAGDGEEAIHRWREDRPEIVLLDQRMPGLTGLATAERILAEDPDQAVVLFTAFLDPDVAASAERLGVRACLSKRDTRALVARLRTCAA
jgi:DNA-binding NarL/FixJ family response regulator